MGVHVVLEGRLTSAETNGPLAGIVVNALTGSGRKPIASAVTDRIGAFELSIDEPDAGIWRPSAAVKLSLQGQGATTPFYRTRNQLLRKWPREGLSIAVPAAALASAFPTPQWLLFADGVPAKTVSVGQTLSIAGRQLQPSTPHEIRLRIGRKSVATVQLTTDAFGTLAPTVIAPQLGLASFDSDEVFKLAPAAKRLGNEPVAVEVWRGAERVARLTAKIAPNATHPLGFVSDADGRLKNSLQWDEEPLHLTVANLPQATAQSRIDLRAYLVPRQGHWHAHDPIRPAADRNGVPLVFELGESPGSGTFQLAGAGRLLPGVYDVIVRPVRYGYEADDDLIFRTTDVAIGNHTTGLVVREPFWNSKVVAGGCVNSVNISGSPVPEPPYFRYRDTFAVGQDVWAALDPGIVMPGQLGRKVALYVIQSKPPAQWAVDKSLSHVASSAPIELPLQAGSINANKALIWPGAPIKGSFDIVADFGNGSANPAKFKKDGSFDTPLDMIDGYFKPGFRVVDDPGTMGEFTNVGFFQVNASLLATYGIGPDMTLEDETKPYFTPGDFTTLTATVPRVATVRFPADVAGASDPSQLSLARPDYPLIVVIHGNGQFYNSYGFVLEHLARNGFIAMAIQLPDGPNCLFRANAFFDHVNSIRAIFGSRLQNNVGVLGHSRGGEAAFKIARLNQERGLGIGLKALMALAPTDQYGRETLTGAAAPPLFVLYGSRDGEVTCGPPTFGYNVKQSGFSLFDRFDGQRKSMAFVYDATHNGFVTFNETQDALPSDAQQAVLLAYANAFFRANLLNETDWEGMFTGEWRPPSVSSTAAKIYFQYRHTHRRVVDNFEGAHTATSWQTSTIGGAVEQTGLPAPPVETQLYPQDLQSPHDTGGLRLTWNGVGEKLSADIPAGQRNVSGFGFVSLRVGQVVGSPLNPAGPQNFRLTLRDGSGKERSIRVGAFGTVPVPAEANVPANKRSSLTTIRIPLSAYTIVAGTTVPVDLSDVVRVSLDFTEVATGEIAIDDLEFTN